MSPEQLAPKKDKSTFRLIQFAPLFVERINLTFRLICDLSVGLVIADKCWPQTMAQLMEEDVVEESILEEHIAVLYLSLLYGLLQISK